MKQHFVRVGLITILCLIVLPLLNGCGLFGGGQTYNGSEQAYEAHPEWVAHTPAYMNGNVDNPDN